MRYVIIGNGIAGVCAAEAIREIDTRGDITLIGDETFPPYSRPMISQVLDGSCPFEKLPIRGESFYQDTAVDPLLGNRVTALDAQGKRVRVGEDTWVPYDRLLIATGADPKPLRVQGADLGNIFPMRTQADVQAQVEALPEAGRAIVLGGGLVGFKSAYGLLKRGLDVTMLISSNYPLSMQVDETAGKMILDELTRHGLKVRVGTDVQAFEGRGKVECAITSEGARLPCDMVVVGKGVRPALSFVDGSSMQTNAGILVDEHLQTSTTDIYAAGDVAETMDITARKRRINAIWPEAAAQGRTAGLNMAGRPVVYRGSLSRNVMRVLRLDVMSLGLVKPGPDDDCRVLCAADPRRKTYRRLVLRESVLVGAVLINRIEQGGVLSALISNEVPLRIPDEALLSPTFNFGRILKG